MSTIRISTNDLFAPTVYRMSFCYLDGEIEEIAGHDVFYSDKPKPTEPGSYSVEYVGANKQVIQCTLVISDDDGCLTGLVRKNDDEPVVIEPTVCSVWTRENAIQFIKYDEDGVWQNDCDDWSNEELQGVLEEMADPSKPHPIVIDRMPG